MPAFYLNFGIFFSLSIQKYLPSLLKLWGVFQKLEGEIPLSRINPERAVRSGLSQFAIPACILCQTQKSDK